tara:strand:- start:3846 stop:4088 length:243 start_codon:yes stop_codon:yes gene_type:complete
MELLKKYLTIKTYFDPDNIDDVEDFERVLKILENEGYRFRTGTQREITDRFRNLYIVYALVMDCLIVGGFILLFIKGVFG